MGSGSLPNHTAMNHRTPCLSTVLSRGLIALPLLFMLALIVAQALPTIQAGAAYKPESSTTGTAACGDRRLPLVAVWVPADLPPHLRRSGADCPI